MPGEYSTFHTCEALCQEEATFYMCAKALCQEKEYEPRILRVPRLMPAIQSKKKKKKEEEEEEEPHILRVWRLYAWKRKKKKKEIHKELS